MKIKSTEINLQNLIQLGYCKTYSEGNLTRDIEILFNQWIATVWKLTDNKLHYHIALKRKILFFETILNYNSHSCFKYIFLLIMMDGNINSKYPIEFDGSISFLLLGNPFHSNSTYHYNMASHFIHNIEPAFCDLQRW